MTALVAPHAWLCLLLTLVAGARLYQVWPAMAAPRRQPGPESGVSAAHDTPDREPRWTRRPDRPSWHPEDCNLDCCWTPFAACRPSQGSTGATPWPRTGLPPVAEARARTTQPKETT